MRTETGLENTNAERDVCPLCGADMVPRRRSALSRMKGFLLAYAAGFAAVWLLPHLDTGGACALALLVGWGVYMMRAAERPWCPDCWFVRQS
ncbi:MAG: hypothetical protein V5A84_02535 [Planctomycetota bacterium]